MLAFALAALPPVLHAATTERVVIDRHTGLAIYGIDPVAYFTERKPTAGRENFELRHAGVVWRFENEGNRAAFAADPEVYMPRFGGYDPIGVSRGVATPGKPALWVVSEQRLYLFYTTEARAAFLANPPEVIAGAMARWSAVQSELAE
ncbi:MAG: YHS domain-containing (seleno)protein [Xanthobacteraceae bacterium]